MTPKEIVESVEARFPLALYQGYRLGTDPDVDGDGDPVLWPKELKAVLTAYGKKAAIRKILYVAAEDVDAITQAMDKPADYLALEMCQDQNGVYIRTNDTTRVDGPDTIRTLKFVHIFGNDSIIYPIRLTYFVKLSACIADDDELPESCDTDLMMDYLEALVGIINSQYQDATVSLDMEMRQKDRAEYIEQRRECEERIASIRALPSAVATN
ncbi:MAG: hypothetical protein GY866_17335 [Proteobacteria bacterium]|nr:hypothetical protein [Pseudomonadota bacterium]